MPIVADLLESGRTRLREAGIEPSARESALLLGRLLGIGEASVLARDTEAVPPEVEARFFELVARRSSGEPTAYLVGEREFWGRPFWVDRRVLIPRPETEHLVEIAFSLPLPERARVLDVGTGSGCIAISLAADRPQWRVVGSDVSLGALAVARANAARNGVADRLALFSADLTDGVDLSAFDLVVGNPPYVEEAIVPYLSRDVRDFEPRVALTIGSDGFDATRRLLAAAAAMRPGTWVVLEFGFGQGEGVLGIADATGHFDLAELRPDLAGIERDVVLRRG